MYNTRKYFTDIIDTSQLELASEVFEILELNLELREGVLNELPSKSASLLDKLLTTKKVGDRDE